MISVSHYNNPFQPKVPDKLISAPVGSSIMDCCERLLGHRGVFKYATVCVRNGQPVLREKWNDPALLQPGDRVRFVTQPGDPISLLIAGAFFVLGAVAIMAFARSNRPRAPIDIPQPDSVFTLAGQRNQNRLTFPIPSAYGRNRLFPDFAAKPYNQYIGNKQYQFLLLCLGQGRYEVEAVQIEDTNIAAFPDVTYEVYGPNEAVTLFPDNVVTSVEVSNIHLFGPNEVEYTGVTGGFTANDAGTQTNRIEVDLVFPGGLYKVNGSGGFDALTVDATFEYRLVDDNGSPLGSWTTLFTFTQTLATNTPQRFTVSTDLAAGRYQIRGVRTNNKDTSASASSDLYWESLRAFLPSTVNYGNVTLMAIRAEASNSLNDNSSNRFNVIATRKLRIYDPGSNNFSDYTATRAFGPAYADIVMSAYGGRMSAGYVDLDGLDALDAIYADRGDEFNYVFDTRSTIWEALSVLARAGRATPLLIGTKFGMVRDAAKTVPVAMFTPDNIVAKSFRQQMRLADLNEYDGTQVEYLDEDTWKPETVLCTLPDESGDNPEQIKLPGVTNRAQAFYEGMYLRACARLLRESATFETGMEGFAPIYSDLLSVGYDVPKWGDFGLVLAIDDDEITLSKDVEFEVDKTYQIALRKKDGSMAGPWTCTAGDAANKVISATAPSVADFFMDREHEPLIFQFGELTKMSKMLLLTGFVPGKSGEEKTEITGTVYSSEVYAYDGLPVPPRGNTGGNTTTPDLPTASGLLVNDIPDSTTEVQVSWAPALGAISYLLQRSFDNESWATVATTSGTVVNMPIVGTAYNYLRLAALNVGVGPYTYWEGFIGTAAAVPGNASISADEYDSTFFRLSWSRLLTAAYYNLKVYTEPSVAGTLTTRTNNTVGTITSTAHPVANAESIDIYWAAGSRKGVVVGTVTANTIPITGGTGDNLPSTSTAITIFRNVKLERTIRVNGLTADYTNIMAQADGTPVRDLYFMVVGVNNIGDSYVPGETGLVTNPLPAAPGSPTSSLKSSIPTLFIYTAEWDPCADTDFSKYRVYGSSTMGFTPGGGNLLYEGVVAEYDISVAAAASHHAAFYWRVVALDVWGNELTNISAEQTIAAV